jgi:hypothetical protein
MDSSSETIYLREAQYYPDKNTNIELRVWILEQMYKELGLENMEEPRVVVLGVGRGADIQAIHKLNPAASFLAAVDAFPSLDHIHTGSLSIPITQSEIVAFLSDEKNKGSLSQANVFVGTRIGSQTLISAIRALPQEGEYTGIFSTDDFISSDSIQRLRDQRPDLEIIIEGNELSGGGEDVFLIKKRKPDLPNT